MVDVPFNRGTRAKQIVREGRLAVNRVTQVPSVTGKMVRLRLDKVTLGAVRFVQMNDSDSPVVHDGDGAIFPYIYVRKRALQEMFGREHLPDELTITLSLD